MKTQLRRLPAMIALLSSGLSLCAATAHAGDPVNLITVTTLTDGVDEFDGQCSLREAVRNASLNQSSPIAGECASGSSVLTDEIVLAGGATYVLTVAGAGNDQGDLDLFQNAPLTLDVRFRSSNANQVTIRQNVVGQRVFENLGLTVEFDNLLIRGGNVDGAGGGILNAGGTVRLNAVNLFSNSATAGGGIHNTGTVQISNSQIQLNTGSFIGGGGIFNAAAGQVFLDNVLLRANSGPSGGAIYNDGGLVSLSNGCAVSLNEATGTDGGAIANLGTGQLTVDRALFENNTAERDGGGIFTTATVSAVVTGSTFTNHNAVRGGAIYQFGTDELLVVDSMFTENSSASHGGAINAARAEIESSQFINNTAFLGNGGALFGVLSIDVRNRSVIRDNTAVDGGGIRSQFADVLDSRVEDNNASGVGGGLSITNAVDIIGSQITGNTSADDGAGLHIAATASGASNIQRSLFMDNTTLNNGGGAWLGGDALIGNTTITLNGANDGGGGLYINDTADVTAINITIQGHLNGQDLHKFGTLRLQNSIISTPGQPDCTTSIENVLILSQGNNIADDESCLGLTQPTDQINTDPQLEVLADNGGSVLSYLPGPTSPARNTGNNAACAANPVNNLDQRNAPRPVAGTCDIGAVEAGAIAPSDLFANGFED